MALAWNAGWVNSPRGFKSRILRCTFCHEEGMGRRVAMLLHASVSIGAGVLFFYFVLPAGLS